MFTPKTHLGRWSIKLTVMFFLLLTALQLLATSGQQGGDTFFSNPGLAIVALLMGISGVLAFVAGTMCIVRDKERSIVVFLCTALGLFVLIFWLGEVLVPH